MCIVGGALAMPRRGLARPRRGSEVGKHVFSGRALLGYPHWRGVALPLDAVEINDNAAGHGDHEGQFGLASVCAAPSRSMEVGTRREHRKLRRRTRVFAAAAVAGVLGIAGCASSPERDEPDSAPTSATPHASVTATVPTNSASAEVPEVPLSATTSISITVNGLIVTGFLQNNAATASLLSQLPLELSFADYGGREKIAGIPLPLSLDGMPSGGSAEPGTIAYYAPDQAIVLYYEPVGYYDGIIAIGTIDDVATVRDSPAFLGTITAN